LVYYHCVVFCVNFIVLFVLCACSCTNRAEVLDESAKAKEAMDLAEATKQNTDKPRQKSETIEQGRQRRRRSSLRRRSWEKAEGRVKTEATKQAQ